MSGGQGQDFAQSNSERSPTSPPLLQPRPRRPHLSVKPPTSSASQSLLGSQQSAADMASTDSTVDTGEDQRLSAQAPDNEELEAPHKSRSILNLTSSALYGIYAPTSYNAPSPDFSRRPSSASLYDQNEPLAISTPWGTGALTPAMRDSGNVPSFTSPSTQRKGSKTNGVSAEQLAASLNHRLNPSTARQASKPAEPSTPSYNILGALLRVVFLAGLGVAYGTLITRLHDTQGIAPVRVGIERHSPLYVGFWSSMAVLLGILLPFLDTHWNRQHPSSNKTGQERPEANPSNRASSQHSLGANWNSVVRSIGAFVGIAFAIRKLPWSSSQQLSLTLALVNPCIWYLVDRSRAGFFLAAVTGITGSLLVLGLMPDVVPSPAVSTLAAASRSGRLSSGSFWEGAAAASSSLGEQLWRPAAWIANEATALKGGSAGPWSMLGSLTLEVVGVATWTSSVLFCSTVLFGNVGRRLWG